MINHYSKTLKFNNVKDMNEFSKNHIMTNEDHLDYYRDGTYNFPMTINATAMFCADGEFTCFISGHDEFNPNKHIDIFPVSDFISVKNAMLETKD